ncbi:MAG: hypothetical protein DRR06_05730 [Gammaproteobacteria bacterium]|nr:MAG: hypothetical protein DRR06_05730 [Gammaproteobacteria bacterium]RLA49287.1 MAG: hypothetical protein DRR42_15740 [Gammaproteobacteria bacterium]
MCGLSKFITVLLIVFLGACSGPRHFEPVQPASSDEGVLYIYRPKADNPGVQPLRYSYPDMILDGESVGVLKFKTYKHLRLRPGKHLLKATGLTEQASWEEKDKELQFDIQPGEIKYLKLSVQYNLSEMDLLQPGARYLLYITPVDAKAALYEIRDTNPE